MPKTNERSRASGFSTHGKGGALTRREAIAVIGVACLALGGCSGGQAPDAADGAAATQPVVSDVPLRSEHQDDAAATDGTTAAATQPDASLQADAPTTPQAPSTVDINEDYRSGFYHGPKGTAYQKYIVLHDTEGDADPESVISWWDSNGNLVAAHFVVGKDGTVFQCVPLDTIAHHAGYGDTGHNALFGVPEDGRDDMAASVWIGPDFADYGMNAYSVGIEMVHIGGSGPYPEAQLDAVDALVAYLDAAFGLQSTIIDHKAWRSGNSDTSPEFATYLANYQDHRTHN